MALLAFEGLALIGTAITTVPVLQDLFNPKPDSSITTKVRLIAGDTDFADGNEPHISLFDRSGNNIGFTTKFTQFGDVISRGQPRDIDVEQIDPSKSANGAEYIALSASEGNAICISIITVTTPTGIKFSWMGDIAKQCDDAFDDLSIPWFAGNVLASIGPKGEVRPNCVWIDGDGTNGVKTVGLGIHLPSFQSNEAREADFQDHPDKMCKSAPRFKAYEALTFSDSIPFFKEPAFDGNTLTDFDNKALDQGNWDQKPVDLSFVFPRQDEGNATADALEARANPNQQRGGKPSGRSGRNGKNRTGKKFRDWKMPGHLVVTPHESHNVQAICKSKSSVGPDIVNPGEGHYCDMDTKTLWKVCKEKGQPSCFDMDTNKMRLGKGNSRRDETSGMVIPQKTYDTVKNWK